MSKDALAGTTRIAAVDDHDSIVDALRLFLEGFGWNVRTYNTGEAFLSDLDGYLPDCVILDPHLPSKNGAEIARRLTDHTKIPFIVLTARPSSPIVTEIADLGAAAILAKPATADDLVNHIQAAIRDSKNTD